MLNNSNHNASSNSSSSVLDVIVEKTANIEQASNINSIRIALQDAIKVHAKREKTLRESTITIRMTGSMQFKEITELIEKDWSERREQTSATYWQDKDSVYAQFISREVKNKFLDFAALNISTEFRDLMIKPNAQGEHIQRKPIRFEINNVRPNIKIDRIETILKRILGPNGKIEGLREGKPNPVTKARGIFFRADAAAFRILIGQLDGVLPYVNMATSTKTRLFMKINCKPWTCRDCFAFGQHQCEGKVCAQCGTAGHLTRDCSQKTKFCRNCKRRGHKAKDTHCSAYLNEVAKEIRKMDIPLEHFEDKDNRFNLIKHLQIR